MAWSQKFRLTPAHHAMPLLPLKHATAWDQYCYVHVTVASQSQILSRPNSARKLLQSILWFTCNSLHINWFYLTCSWLISHEFVWFLVKVLPDFHTFSRPGHHISGCRAYCCSCPYTIFLGPSGAPDYKAQYKKLNASCFFFHT